MWLTEPEKVLLITHDPTHLLNGHCEQILFQKETLPSRSLPLGASPWFGDVCVGKSFPRFSLWEALSILCYSACHLCAWQLSHCGENWGQKTEGGKERKQMHQINQRKGTKDSMTEGTRFSQQWLFNEEIQISEEHKAVILNFESRPLLSKSWKSLPIPIKAIHNTVWWPLETDNWRQRYYFRKLLFVKVTQGECEPLITMYFSLHRLQFDH